MERFTTDEVPGPRRLRYWSDLLTETFTGLSVESVDKEYAATLTRAQVGRLVLSNPCSSAARLFHAKRQAAKLEEECVLVHYQMRGSCEFSQLGRTAYLQDGDFVIADAARPYTFALSASHRMMVIRVPTNSLCGWRFEADRLCGVKMAGSQPASRLLSDYLRTVWDDILPQTAMDLPGPLLAKTIIDMIELMCTPYGCGGRRTLRREASRDDIMRFMEDNLFNPSLSVGFVAASLKITPRYIQKLFAEIETTPWQHVCSMRIRAAAQRLEDPNCHGRSISDLAFAIGFNDLSHFGRLFKSKYGHTPAEHRRRALGPLRSARPGSLGIRPAHPLA